MELRNGGNNGRSAPGRKMFDGRTEGRKVGNGNYGQEGQRRCNRHVNGGGVHAAVGEHRDRALVPRLVGIRMEPLVQRRRRRHGIEQEDNAGQYHGHGHLAVRFKMALRYSQTICFYQSLILMQAISNTF